MAAEDDRPLQEELVLVEARLLETRVLETQASELRQPQRQVRRIRRRVARDVIEVLCIVESGAGILAVGGARREGRVGAARVWALGVRLRRGWGRPECWPT